MKITCAALIGTSNSGKSPLGRKIESKSTHHGPRVVHLDFGDCLRKAAISPELFRLTADEHRYVQSVLDGTLFDDAHFPTAARIIKGYMGQRKFQNESDILLLNGIPRRLGQAQSLAAEGFAVGMVIRLDCDMTTALRRYELAHAGKGHEDRSERNDNNPETIRRKLESYHQDTEPVLQWYQNRSIPGVGVRIGETTTPEETYNLIAEKLWTNVRRLQSDKTTI